MTNNKEIRHPNGAYQRLGCGYDYQLEVGRHEDARRHFLKIVAKTAGATAVVGLVIYGLVAGGEWLAYLRLAGVR
jgi:hypothetical protein